MFLKGEGLRRDPMKAHSLFKRAAEAGETDALYWLAKMYENGDGVVLDIDEAIRHMEAAAKAGHKDAVAWLEKRRDNEINMAPAHAG